MIKRGNDLYFINSNSFFRVCSLMRTNIEGKSMTKLLPWRLEIVHERVIETHQQIRGGPSARWLCNLGQSMIPKCNLITATVCAYSKYITFLHRNGCARCAVNCCVPSSSNWRFLGAHDTSRNKKRLECENVEREDYGIYLCSLNRPSRSIRGYQHCNYPDQWASFLWFPSFLSSNAPPFNPTNCLYIILLHINYLRIDYRRVEQISRQ